MAKKPLKTLTHPGQIEAVLRMHADKLKDPQLEDLLDRVFGQKKELPEQADANDMPMMNQRGDMPMQMSPTSTKMKGR